MAMRIYGWASLALILVPLATASAQYGTYPEPPPQPFSAPKYSPLHYWLPGIYRVHACLQPLQPDSPQPPLLFWRHYPEGRVFHLRNKAVAGHDEAPTETVEPAMAPR